MKWWVPAFFTLFTFFRIFELHSKVLTFEKTQIIFGFLLTYSYLCPRKDELYEDKTTTYLAIHGFCHLLARSGEEGFSVATP